MQRSPLAGITEGLTKRLTQRWISSTSIIPWSSPVPVFGDLDKAHVATLGLNPSNREFVDEGGHELDGEHRRLPTLRSLGLKSWAKAATDHVEEIVAAGRTYFEKNPYDGWFRDLDRLLAGTQASYYCDREPACHLDLIPFATARKWTELTMGERRKLLDHSGDTLGLVLRESNVRLLVLNGASVTAHLERLAGVTFERVEMKKWQLPRRVGLGVSGFAYSGYIQECGGITLDKRVRVIGFNHNIQSSFGVTSAVKAAIRDWIGEVLQEAQYA